MHHHLHRLAVGFCLMVLGGCAGTDPTRFYVLSSLPRTERQVMTDKQGVAIGVGPVEIPQYLDRPQIVTRASQNELDIADLDHWAEPLKNNLSNVLAENLSILIPTDRIALFPWNRSTPIDYQVTVKVTRFEGKTGGGDSSLIARWSILKKNSKEVILSRKSSFNETGGAENYNATVSAMNQAVEHLSREIAAAIKKISM